jgi:hypothetical protein
VLEEMGEAGASGALVGGADVIPEVDGHEREPMILGEDDLQAIREGVFLHVELGHRDRMRLSGCKDS